MRKGTACRPTLKRPTAVIWTRIRRAARRRAGRSGAARRRGVGRGAMAGRRWPITGKAPGAATACVCMPWPSATLPAGWCRRACGRLGYGAAVRRPRRLRSASSVQSRICSIFWTMQRCRSDLPGKKSLWPGGKQRTGLPIGWVRIPVQKTRRPVSRDGCRPLLCGFHDWYCACTAGG